MIETRFKDGVPSHYRDPRWLRNTGVVPHYFGLGFIQMKLEANLRIHVWHPSLQPITGEEEVHNHRYDFHSTVLAGCLVHETWSFEGHASGRFEMVEVSCKPDAPADPVSLGTGTMRRTGRYVLPAGSSYFFTQREFHRTIATSAAVTLLERDTILTDNALVLRPLDAPSVCPFSKTVDEDQLWKLIDEALA